MSDTEKDYVASSLEEARDNYKKAETGIKNAGKNQNLKKKALADRARAGAELEMYKCVADGGEHAHRVIENHTKQKTGNDAKIKQLNKDIVAARRKFYIIKAINESTGMEGSRVNQLSITNLNKYLKEKYPNQKITIKRDELLAIHNEYYRNYKAKGLSQVDFQNKVARELSAKKTEKSKLEAKNKEHQRNIDMANKALAAAEEYKKKHKDGLGTRNLDNGNTGTGNDGGENTGGGKKNEVKDETITKSYPDKDNPQATATYDKNGNMLSCTFKDKDGKDQTLKADEIKKANVKVEDIKDALESGDLKKALELLMEALMSKNNNYQPLQQQITSKTYVDEANNATFKVDKQGDKVSSVTFMEEGVMREPLTLTADHFSKAGVDPKAVEASLEKKDYRTAALSVFDVAAKNNIEIKRYFEPEIGIVGENIILRDRNGNEFELSKAKLKAMDLNTNASGTMKKLKAALSVDPRPQGIEHAIASYFRNETPAPNMPPQKGGNWTVTRLEKSSADMARGVFGTSTKSVYITVKNAQGQEKELHAKDFAKYFNCSKEDGKKILRAYARAIENGANLDGVISSVADQALERKSTRTMRTVGAVALGVGAAGAVVGGTLLGIKAFKKGGNEDENQPTTESSPAPTPTPTPAPTQEQEATPSLRATETPEPAVVDSTPAEPEKEEPAKSVDSAYDLGDKKLSASVIAALNRDRNGGRA